MIGVDKIETDRRVAHEGLTLGGRFEGDLFFGELIGAASGMNADCAGLGHAWSFTALALRASGNLVNDAL